MEEDKSKQEDSRSTEKKEVDLTTGPAGEQYVEKQEKTKKNLFAGASFLVLFTIMIAVLVTMQLQKNNGNEEPNASADTIVADCGGNTELSGGDVTAMIDGKSINYSGAYVVDGVEATICSGVYESTTDNQAVFLVINGGTLRVDGEVTINKTGSADFQGRGDNYSFYGINSAIVVVGEGSSASINGVTISTDVSGANAVVATDEGEVVIKDSTISTTKDNSRGLHATYAGSINADAVKISTLGGSSASLATDRGEGTIVANNMSLATAGAGSPLIYSTGKITVTNSVGKAIGAQIAVVEGKNSINLQGCEFYANGIGNRNGVDNAGVMVYQSMSGDAGEGVGNFTATDCKLGILEDSNVYKETPFFFITNTEATILLTGTTISFDNDEYFVLAHGTNEWGRNGNNGGKVEFTMSNVSATNTKVEVDSISNVSGV